MDARATAARALRAARGVVVLSGAGASAESGLPTFRDADGLWRGHDLLRLATPEGFERDPDGGWLRPNVVWFGERLPDAALRAAEETLRWCEALVVVGTSALVYPAAGVITAAAAAGAVTIEVNREASAAPVDVRLIGRAGAVVPRLVAAVVDHRV